MKYVKLFEEFISEDATQVTADSDVMVDDYTTDDGVEIKSKEIVGAIVSCKTEKDFTDYFYAEYGNNAFTENDLNTLVKYFNEYQEELNAEKAEEESEEEDGAADLDLGDDAADSGEESTDSGEETTDELEDLEAQA